MKDWDWNSDEAKDSMAVESVRGVAVYTNAQDQVVIRQEAFGLGDEDQVIVLPRAAIEALILALQVEIQPD